MPICWRTLVVLAAVSGTAFADEPVAPEDEAVESPLAPVDEGVEETGDIEDDEGDEDDGPAPPQDPVRKGLQLQGSLGLGDCLGGFCSHGDERRMENTRIGIGLEISGWYRIIPLVSVGGSIHYNLIGVHDQERVGTSADLFAFAIGGRIHPLQTGVIDPFAGLTFAYVVYGVSADFDGFVQNETINGIALGLHVGAEWYFAPRMSVGGLLAWTFPSLFETCIETVVDDEGSPPTEDCDTISDLPPSLQNDFPASTWYLGGIFSYHLGG